MAVITYPQRGIDARALAVLVALATAFALLPVAPTGAADEGPAPATTADEPAVGEQCWVVDEPSAGDAQGMVRDDEPARRAAIAEYCVTYTEEVLELRLRVDEPVDPATDSGWSSDGQHPTGVQYGLTTSGEQFPDEGADYRVSYRQADEGVLFTQMVVDDGPACDGEASVEGDFYVATFDGDCLEGAEQVGISATSAYDGDPDDPDGAQWRVSSEPGQDGFSPPVQRGDIADGAVQDIWMFADIRALGEDGTETSVIDDVVDELAASAAPAVSLSDHVDFHPTPALGGAVVDYDGVVREEIDVTVGLFELTSLPDDAEMPGEAVGDATLGYVTTVTDGDTNVAGGDYLRLENESVAALDGVELALADYSFGQAFATPGEAGLDPVEVLAQRWSAESLSWVGADDGDDGGPGFWLGVPMERMADAETQDASDVSAAVVGDSFEMAVEKGLFGPEDLVLIGYCTAVGAFGGPKGAVLGAVVCTSISALSTFTSLPDAIEDNKPNGDPPGCVGCPRGTTWGDPHLVTFDGTRYDLHPVGEFVLVDGGDDLEVQTRMGQVRQTRTLAWNIGAAVQIHGDVVVVDPDAGAPATVVVNGEDLALDTQDRVELDGGGTLRRWGGSVQLQWQDDTRVTATLYGARGHRSGTVRQGSVDVVVEIDPDRAGAVSGLLGNADGDRATDLATPEGQTYVDPTFDELYDEFAESWRVDEDRNLFDELTHDRSFPDREPSRDDFTAAELARAETVCRAAGLTNPELRNCIFDVAATGDPTFAGRASLTQAQTRPGAFNRPSFEPVPGRCFMTPAGSVIDGEAQARDDAAADHADILEVCVEFTADELVLSVDVAEPTDPASDPNWTQAGETELRIGLANSASQEFEDQDVVLGDGGYLVRVIPQPTGGWRALLGDDAYRCDGVPEFLDDEGYRITFNVDDDSACLEPGDDRLAVRPTMIYDTDPDDEDPTTLRVDTHPGQDGHYGWIDREGVDDPPDAPAFDDTAGNIHEHSIERLVAWGITQGISDTAYGPRLHVTRAQLATFLVRVAEAGGHTFPAASDQGFTDIAGNPHAASINQLADAGVISGTSATTYSPQATVNRAGMTTFLVNTYQLVTGSQLPAGSTPFTDIAGNPHEQNIQRAYHADFVAGTGATTYSPAGHVTRDAMASFLMNVIDRLVDEGHAQPPS